MTMDVRKVSVTGSSESIKSGWTRFNDHLTGAHGYVVDPTETDQGKTGDSKTVKAYMDDIGGTKNATLIFPHLADDANTTTYTFTTTEVITSNITCVVQAGAILSDGGGAANLTIQGPLITLSGDPFAWTGSGAVTISGTITALCAKLALTGYITTTGGIHVGGTSDPGADNLLVDGYVQVADYVTAEGGVHVGGTSDPGADNLVVDGSITVAGTPLGQNLLTNSGFGVWSNSEDLYVAATSGGSTEGDVPCTTNVCVGCGLAPDNSCTTPDTGDTEADATTGWTNVSFNGFASDTESSEPDGSHSLHLTANANNQNCKMDTTTVEIGKLYELNIVYKTIAGDAGSAFRISLGTAASGTQYYDETGIFDNAWATKTVVFEATTTSFYLTIWEDGVGNDVEVYIDQVSLHEVTPGCVAASAVGPDGWTTATAHVDVWRMHSDGATEAITKLGSFYALKVVASEASVAHNINQNFSTHPYSFIGRTLTFGAWTKTDTAASVILSISGIGGSETESDAHTGGGDWEWLEVTHTFAAGATNALVYIYVRKADTAYISQPMLVFGSAIGSGNYVQPPGEIVNVEANIALTDYTAAAAAAGATIKLEAQSSGKIPKGCKTVYGWWSGQNSAADKFVMIRSESSGVIGSWMHSQVAGKDVAQPFRAVCDTNGDIYISPEDTPSSNWTNVYIQVNAIELK